MKTAFLILTAITLTCAASAFATTPVRVGNGWATEAECVRAHHGRTWCRMQDCSQNSTGPCLNQPKRVIWFYMPPGKK